MSKKRTKCLRSDHSLTHFIENACMNVFFFRTNRMLEHVLSFPLHVSVTPQVKICFNHTQLGTKKFNKILLQSSKAFIRF